MLWPLMLLLAMGCASAPSSPMPVTAPSEYAWSVTVMVSGVPAPEPLRAAVRVIVRADDDSILFSGDTNRSGFAEVRFRTNRKPKRIEAIQQASPDVFSGALISVLPREDRYCIVLPPGCHLN